MSDSKPDAWSNPGPGRLFAGKLPRDWFFKILGFSLLALAGLPMVLFHDQAGMDYQSAGALYILALAVYLWISSLIPHGITALLILVLVPVLNIMPLNQTLAAFGNTAVFFLLGVFIMVAAVIDSGLARRISLLFLKSSENTLGKVYVSIYTGCLFMSFLMPEHAVAAIFFPIVLEISKLLGEKTGNRPMGMLLFMGMAWGAVVGGIGTLLGGARASLAIEFLKDMTGKTVTFWDHASVGVPVALILGVVVLVVFPFMIRGISLRHKLDPGVIHAMRRNLGPMSFREKRVAVIFAAVILLWMVAGAWLHLATVSLLGAVLMFVARGVEWKKVDELVNWNVILMYGGAIVLGYVLNHTQAGSLLLKVFPDSWLNSEITMVLIFAVVTITLTEFMSNAAALTIVLPIVLTAAIQHNLDVMIIFYSITLISGLAFVFPMSSPPNAIAFSSGTFTVNDMVVKGIIVSIISLIVVLTYLFIRFNHV
ncbi:MAG: DASS family sodium-coupled anion symporter [Bacteroidetes bacterium]|nr:DASS family sodium-coupled anion symporter [Bacteroidota bacterium]